MKIAIDTGHCISGADKGAQSNSRREEVLTREIGNKVINKLKSLGHIIILVSPDYASTVRESLNYRINKINSSSVDISVSIHLNAGGGKGVEIYTKNGADFEEAITILKNMASLGYINRGIKNGSDLALVGAINVKAMLIECGFIDSSSDMAIYNAEKIADAIVNGIILKRNNTNSNNSGSNILNNKNYLNLRPNVIEWRVYPVNVAPVIGNEIGFLAPASYGGLSYKILGNPMKDVYTIKTSTFGTVNIYAPRDNDSTITYSPVY